MFAASDACRQDGVQISLTDCQVEMDTVPSDITRWVPNPEELYSSCELREILRGALKQLSPCSRMVFVLRDIEELSINETAEVLSLTPNAVKARLFRARLQLREKLSKYFAKDRNRNQLPNFSTTSVAGRISDKAMTAAV